MIVNERITAYINSLDRGNGSLCDEVEEEAVSSYVPIIRKETSALLKTLVAMKRPERILDKFYPQKICINRKNTLHLHSQ